jgi:hypothetical protein
MIGASVSNMPVQKPSWDVIQGKQGGGVSGTGPYGSTDELLTTPVTLRIHIYIHIYIYIFTYTYKIYAYIRTGLYWSTDEFFTTLVTILL